MMFINDVFEELPQKEEAKDPETEKEEQQAKRIANAKKFHFEMSNIANIMSSMSKF